ncbi:MAG: hypothetical protein WC588_05025 [Candidatus Micrarchaeia archaeon]
MRSNSAIASFSSRAVVNPPHVSDTAPFSPSSATAGAVAPGTSFPL